MPPIKILRLKRYKGGSFLSELGRYSRPILRILAKHAGPLLLEKLKKAGSQVIREGADVMTSAVLSESRKRKGAGVQKGGKKRRKRRGGKGAPGKSRWGGRKSIKKKKRRGANIQKKYSKKSVVGGKRQKKKKVAHKKLKKGGKKKRKPKKASKAFSIFN